MNKNPYNIPPKTQYRFGKGAKMTTGPLRSDLTKAKCTQRERFVISQGLSIIYMKGE